MMRGRSTRAHLGRDRGHEQEVDQQVEDQLHQGETEEDQERDVIKVKAGQEEDKKKIDEKELGLDLGTNWTKGWGSKYVCHHIM